jgi:hypothetical protein
MLVMAEIWKELRQASRFAPGTTDSAAHWKAIEARARELLAKPVATREAVLAWSNEWLEKNDPRRTGYSGIDKIMDALSHFAPPERRRLIDGMSGLPAQPWRPQMDTNELDPERAKDIAYADIAPGSKTIPGPDKYWVSLTADMQEQYLVLARAIREGDARRGIVSVPREATEKMLYASAMAGEKWEANNLGAPLPDVMVWDTMLAASPFAEPEP